MADRRPAPTDAGGSAPARPATTAAAATEGARPAAAQLSLELEPILPAPPESLRPMLSRPAPAAFDSPDHVFEPTWGGVRALAFLEPAVVETSGGAFLTAAGEPSVRLVGEDGIDVAPRLPELGTLAMRLDASSAVLDGELVVVDRLGRADPLGLGRRLSGALGRAVAYLAFDVLYLDGRLLLSWPLERRRRELARVVRPGPEVVVVPATVGEGRALHDAVVAQGLAGVRARVRSSPYLPGVRSRLWRTIDVPLADAVSPEPPPDEREPPPTAPVLAVIERLPLPEDDAG